MKTKQHTIGTRSIAFLVVMWAASAVAAPVRVKVFEHVAPGGATYFYRVENGSTQPIVGLKIGFDRVAGVPQLATTPAGWTLEGGLPASSTTAPAGWVARVVLTEETDHVEVEWTSDGGPQGDIAPGATVSFSVKVPQQAAEYRTSKWDVTHGNGTHAHGTLEPDPDPPQDSTAPTLNVTLTPAEIWPPNGKMCAIQATIAVSDDLDAQPRVRLVSITASEELGEGDVDGAAFGTDDRQFALRASRSGTSGAGRVYTVTYSATDAAGNSTTATATVTVLHDQRR